MHEEENSSTRCLIKHQNEFRRNRREAVFLFAALPMSAYWHKADIPSCTAHVRSWG